jgi:hypothetical protein
MKIFVQIGSLTLGATLAFFLTHFTTAGLVGCCAAAVGCAIYTWYARRRFAAAKAPLVYRADSEAERYTASDVTEFLNGLSEARIRSASPFYAEAAGPRNRSPATPE